VLGCKLLHCLIVIGFVLLFFCWSFGIYTMYVPCLPGRDGWLELKVFFLLSHFCIRPYLFLLVYFSSV
jgi:hypothetical protein